MKTTATGNHVKLRKAAEGHGKKTFSFVLPLLLAVAFCCLPVLSFAAFEVTDTGARQSGMGEAYTAIGGDTHSLLHNPAGLAYLSRKELSSSYSKLFMGLDDKSNISSSQLLYGQPVTARGSLGVGWMETKLDSLYKERTLSLGYGYDWKDNLAIGAALKQLQIMEASPEVNYDNNGSATGNADRVFANGNTATGMGIDLGILYTPISEYSLGLSLQNINQPKVSLADSDRVPLLSRFGIARRSPALLVAVEIRTQEFILGVRDYQTALGAEKWWGKNSSFALRGSLAIGSRSFSQFTLGMGYRINGVQVDYSFLMPLSGISFGNTYGSHRISFSARFGKAVPKKISWEMAEPQFAIELEKMQQRAAQAEQTAWILQEQSKALWDELEKQKQILASISTTSTNSDPSASLLIKDLGLQIQDLRQQMETTKHQKSPENPQAELGPSADQIIRNLAIEIQDLKEQIEKIKQKPAETSPAKPEFSKIVTDPKKAQEFFQEGMRYYSSRQLGKAVQAFQKSLEFDPTNEWTKKSLERTLTELEQKKAQQKPDPKDKP
ncbi:MAG: hypothetical protein A2270_02630 [Elusimicrobia bacterium RIFOXYA12_FULL_51_18]|nr:MAG: hypothetical protein A2270_02630 [Elusimicrobia bacterium RIFOXYA12_FULL_51_18]OGS31306.1 MAG: hypothetical protein A2218_08215 [Elusimicrobia bacterium RIFOXYA2_FULL_53_38]